MLEYIPVDLIGYNCLGVVSVDIYQRPQFTSFAIVQVHTQPELPLVSPLTLWCAENILHIARFDALLQQTFPVVQSKTDGSLRAILTKAL